MHRLDQPTSSADTLPCPDAEGESRTSVVIYDGACAFCQARCRQLMRCDRGARLTFLSLHDPLVGQLFPELTTEAMLYVMHVVAPSGQVYRGAESLRYLCRVLPRLWWLLPLLYIPFSLPLWQWLYQQVAIRRYRLAASAESASAKEAKHGGACDGTCAIHMSPSVRRDVANRNKAD